MKTMAQQIHSMKRNWPAFDMVPMGREHVTWFGDLIGIQKSYRVMIEFGLPVDSSSNPLFRCFPQVRVIKPRLRPNWKALEETPLPHVYFDVDDIPNSPLCLFDPLASEWSHNDFIALTTVPWTCDWLASYEGWLATERWFAGGRHATPQADGAKA
jgi:hypothetical protein